MVRYLSRNRGNGNPRWTRASACDGFPLQAGLDPEGFDPDAAFAVLAQMVTTTVR